MSIIQQFKHFSEKLHKFKGVLHYTISRTNLRVKTKTATTTKDILLKAQEEDYPDS